MGDHPAVQDLVGVVKVMLDHYDQGKIDAVYIAYNEFVNTMTQKPIIRQLLPLVDNDDQSKLKKAIGIIFMNRILQKNC